MTHFLTRQGPAELIWHQEETRWGFSLIERSFTANTHDASTNPPRPGLVDRFCLKK